MRPGGAGVRLSGAVLRVVALSRAGSSILSGCSRLLWRFGSVLRCLARPCASPPSPRLLLLLLLLPLLSPLLVGAAALPLLLPLPLLLLPPSLLLPLPSLLLPPLLAPLLPLLLPPLLQLLPCCCCCCRRPVKWCLRCLGEN